MLKVKKESSKVLYLNQPLAIIEKKYLNYLKKMANRNKEKIIRLCLHKNKKENVHEMIIYHPKNYFVRPHMHPKNSESMLILKGEIDVIIFNKNGKIKNIIKMGDINSGKPFYYKLQKKTYHTLLIKSNYSIFFEISEGAFSKNKNYYPKWAPPKKTIQSKKYLKYLLNQNI